MPHPDVRGNPCSSTSAVARDALEHALWRLVSFYDAPLADLDAATAADPAWCLPHLVRAGFFLGLNEPAMQPQALAALALAQPGLAHATAREKAHHQALQQLAQGRWHQASRTWHALLLQHPRDLLALQWAHVWDFYRGDTEALRQLPARALPEWLEDDPLYPYALALHAFGLEENNLYPQAEDAGRRALGINPRVPWAMHAVAHVMEMQGRYEDGAVWLRQQQPQWAEGNGFAVHLWWHKTLFRLEALDVAGALRLVDCHMANPQLEAALQRVDTAAALWRLWLLGEDVTARCAALVGGWALDDGNGNSNGNSNHHSSTSGAAASGYTPGHYAFTDWHVVMALVGAGDVPRAEHWVARCAQQLLQAPTQTPALAPGSATAATAAITTTNHTVARDVGLPLMRGVLALARGNADGACDSIGPVRGAAQRLGGSRAQRDLIDQTLMAAAAQGGRTSLGLAVLNERRMAKPLTPLTRHWLDQLASHTHTRA
jgi:tetratricopeptide (TPR) repeat protein